MRFSDQEVSSLSPGDRDWMDPELEALLAAVTATEDDAEAQRAELALMTHLVRKNCMLTADELALLMTFASDDPALAALQDAVHGLVVERMKEKADLRAAERSEQPNF